MKEKTKTDKSIYCLLKKEYRPKDDPLCKATRRSGLH